MIMPSSSRIMPAAPEFVLDAARHDKAVRLFRRRYNILGSREPDEILLQNILAGFSHLPYENLSKIIKFHRHGAHQAERLRLPEEVIEDHLRRRLGGTCFSLTFFLQAILLHHGFPCYIVMADMKAGKNIHCAMIVLLNGVKHLIDPGYQLRQPMMLDPNRPRLYHTEFTGVELRFNPAPAAYEVFTFNRQAMKWRYRFVDHPTPPEEFLQHWQASFNRNSMHALCLTRATNEELIYLRKDFMRISNLAGKRNVSIKGKYHETIQQTFGIAPEYVEQALAALVAQATPAGRPRLSRFEF